MQQSNINLDKKIIDGLGNAFLVESLLLLSKLREKDSHLQLLNYLSQSGILEEYNKIIYNIVPVICSGLLSSDVISVDHDIIIRAKKFIENQYPIYKEKAEILKSTYCRNINHILDCLEKDFLEIKNNFHIRNPSVPIAIKIGAGDSHWGGKSVAIILFGDSKQIVYKPRALSLDIAFYNLLSKLDSYCNIGFYIPRIIIHDNYSWEEYVPYEQCASLDSINEYYYRIGAIMAILYVLEATDVHYENIICKGPYPVIIDLESVFCPYNPIDGAETNQGLYQSILRSGLLPAEFSIMNNSECLDVSGMSDVSKVKSPLSHNKYEYNADGTVNITNTQGYIREGQNIPRFNNQTYQLTSFTDYITGGFSKAYLAILEHRKAFSEIIHNCSGLQVRVILRNTVAYCYVINQTNQLISLQDKRVFHDIIDRCLSVNIPEYKVLARVFPYEVSDIQKMDIPLFVTRSDSKDLWYSDDANQKLDNFFDKTGIDTVLEKLGRLSLSDLECQVWMIKSAINIKKIIAVNRICDTKAPSSKKMLEEYLRIITKNVFDAVKKNIHITEDYAHWLIIQPTSLNSSSYRIYEASYDLFYGMSGTILFLSYYGQIYDDREAQSIALKSYHYLIDYLNNCKDSIRTLGLYTGWGSIIYLNDRLYEIYKDERYLLYNEKLIRDLGLKGIISRDNYYGLIKGTAGLIVALCDYFNLSHDEYAKGLATYAGDYLIAKRTIFDRGIGWRISSHMPLSGLSHGSSGFALAFLRLSKITNVDYTDIIREIIEYENSLFIESEHNWEDVRDYIVRTYGKGVCSTAWSHGAGGIGLLRLELLKNGICFTGIREQLKWAIETVRKKGFTNNLDLSFGGFGNIELLLNFLLYTNDNDLRWEYNSILIGMINNYFSGKYTLGTPFITIGLMTGIAGIGFECMRILYPNKVKSVLVA